MNSRKTRDYQAMILSRWRIVAISVILLSFFGRVTARELDSNYVYQIRAGIRATICEQFEKAKQTFQTLIDEDSLDHAAYFLLAAALQGEMFDCEDYRNRPVFDSLIGLALRLADRDIDRKQNLAWAHLTKGNAYAYIATAEAKNGSWWKAMRKGLAAKGEYLDALEANPRLFDAYLGIGSYHYWKSAKTEFINWLPLIPDRKEEGLEELRLAIDSSLFSGDLAANSLVWIDLDRGDAQAAYKIASELHAKYPDSRLFTWAIAFSSYYAGRLAEAADFFGKILDQIEHRPDQNNFNTIECRFHRAKIFLSLRENEKARNELEALLAYPVSDDVKGRQKEKLQKAQEMLKSIK